jgi:FAD:protein FMN transferase
MACTAEHPEVRLACAAMGTRFELLLEGEDPRHLQAAGEMAIDEVLLWHQRLTAFEPSSVLSHIHRSGTRWCCVDAETFRLLEVCRQLWQLTYGAFDPTVGPLMHAWGLRGIPRDDAAVEAATRCTGMSMLDLDCASCAVRLNHPDTRLDLGAIGKGWSLDRAVEILRNEDVSRAFIHGGTSSVVVIGEWNVTVKGSMSLTLKDQSLSVSAPHGCVRDGAHHIINPITHRPAATPLTLAAVIHDSAAIADALSTAVLVNPALRAYLSRSFGALIHTEPPNA